MVSSRKYMISSAITSAVLLVALLFALFAMNPSLGWFSDAEEATATGMQVKSKVVGIEAEILKVTLVRTNTSEEISADTNGVFYIEGFVPGDKIIFELQVTNIADQDVNLTVNLAGNKNELPHISKENDEYLWLSTQLFISSASSSVDGATALVPSNGSGRAYLYPVSGYDPKSDPIPTNLKVGKAGEHYCSGPLHSGLVLDPGETCTLSYTLGFVNSDVDQEEFKSDHFNGTAGKQPGYFAPYFEVDYSDKD